MAGIRLLPTVLLLSAWPMNEGSGLTFFDAAGGGNNQTIAASSGSWGTVVGFPGTVFTFNGTGGSTGATNALTNFTGTTPFSVSMWIIPTSGGAFTPILSTIQGSSPFTGWDLGEISGALQFRLINTYPSNYLRVMQAALPVGSLTYVVVTYDGSQHAAGVSIYYNGTAQTTTIPSDTLTGTIANANTVEVGMDRAGDLHLATTMAFVEIYNVVLSQARISANYALGPGIY
jgi:hypothetical protein